MNPNIEIYTDVEDNQTYNVNLNKAKRFLEQPKSTYQKLLGRRKAKALVKNRQLLKDLIEELLI